MPRDFNELAKIARDLGGEGNSGINWDWYYFESHDNAAAFEAWCVTNGFETRGVYSPTEHDPRYGVRFR